MPDSEVATTAKFRITPWRVPFPSFFVSISIVGLLLIYGAICITQQHQAVDELKQLGVRIHLGNTQNLGPSRLFAPTVEHIEVNKDLPLDDQQWQRVCICLQRIARVKSLELPGRQLNRSSLQIISQLRGLEELSLQGCSLKGDGQLQCHRLSELRALDLKETGLADSAVVGMETLSKLCVAQLHSSQLSLNVVQQLQKANPSCEIDWWPRPSPEHLALQERYYQSENIFILPNEPASGVHLVRSWNLSIYDGRISATAIRDLRSISMLHECQILGQENSDYVLSKVAQLPSLKIVHCIGASITPRGLDTLASLPNLETVVLRDCWIEEHELEYLRQKYPQIAFESIYPHGPFHLLPDHLRKRDRSLDDNFRLASPVPNARAQPLAFDPRLLPNHTIQISDFFE